MHFLAEVSSEIFDQMFQRLLLGFPTPARGKSLACVRGLPVSVAHSLDRLGAATPEMAKATEQALCRVWAGIHFPSCIEAGREMAIKVSQLVIAWAEADGSK